MIFRSFNTSFVPRLLVLLGLSVGLGAAIILVNPVWIVLCSLMIIISFFEILNKIEGVNRKLTYFFDAVRNEDSTLHFPDKIKDKSTRELHESLNHLNDLISEIKIKNEYKERFYRELLTYSSTGIIALDDEGYVDLINPSALRLLEMPQLGHIKLLKQKNESLFNELVGLKPGQTQTLKILHKEELQLVSVKLSRIAIGERHYRIFSLYDIKAELEENEVESWQKLIRVLTHEIMNSIAPITSLSKTLQRILNSKKTNENCAEDEIQVAQTREGLSVIEETGKGLMHFIDNYRRLTKLPNPVFKSIVIKDWLGRVILLMKERLDMEQVELQLNYKTNQKEFPGDEKLLSQVIINILNNAMDAMHDCKSKKISITTTYDSEGKLEFAIADCGKGIPEDELDKIFIPFFTTKENGSGVGLSISRQIVRMHKGSLSVTSRPGKQTVFYLRF